MKWPGLIRLAWKLTAVMLWIANIISWFTTNPVGYCTVLWVCAMMASERGFGEDK